ncbi:uncharacterized protein LOC129743341 [Uranotaenia lowii]|uniref:uncharacterized protein LOC129743341 n=1 Tax=Uranotaenia lowii TaxID=190385 RepID=UPI002478F13B|nr:uncharacterized protein LOC129743341 [Uranotaenia lowii]
MAAEKKIQVMSYYRMIDSIESRAEKLLLFVRSFDTEKQESSLLEDKLESIDQMRSLLHETEVKLYGVIKEDEVGSLQMTIEKIEDLFDDIRHRVRKIIREIDPPKPISAPAAVNSTQHPHTKLPDIPLPRFNGQLEEWLTFKSQFNSLIKRRESLSESEKLFYLKAAIQDGSARHVQSSEDNFSSLWKALCSEFENKRLLVDRHIAQLFHLKPLVRESGSALRTLLSDVTRNIRALANLELKLEPLSEQFLVFLVCARLDTRTRKDFELQFTDHSLPSWEKLLEYLQSRCRCLESIDQDKQEVQSSSFRGRFGHNERSGSHSSKVLAINTGRSYGNPVCFACKGNHYLSNCEDYLKLQLRDRISKVRSLGLCMNCFSNRHHVRDCKGSSCKKCGGRHHTTLHENNANQPTQPTPTPRRTPEMPTTSSNALVASVACTNSQPKQYILYTAVCMIEDEFGNLISCRVLLDSGSMHNLISTRVVNALRLRKTKVNMSVEGISGAPKMISSQVRVKIHSTYKSDFTYSTECLVMSKITGNLPINSFNIDPGQIPSEIVLADPWFSQSRRIDMLLGIQVFHEMFTGQTHTIIENPPCWCEETVFGWVVGGAIERPEVDRTISNVCKIVTNEALSEQISRFWEAESIHEPRMLTHDERAAEQSFSDTCCRLENGRYEVGLPLRPSIKELGDSQTIALRRFLQTEKRLIHDQDLYDQYREFMHDYETQGHMIRCDTNCSEGYFLPHHAVLNLASTTTKTRVVFDASAAASRGGSLNDHLYVGPTIQPKLAEIVLRFRVPKIVFTADITQMFRQIRIRAEDQKYQQIFWRRQPNEALEVFHLTTVTYGTACAPFLATRTLEQLCTDEKERFPLASKAGTEDVYMDDILSGADTLEDALNLQTQFVEMTQAGGFNLHEWASNHPELMRQIDNTEHERAFFEDEKTTRTLGLTWQPRKDVFLTRLHEIEFHLGQTTKRTIYSDIAKLYDPLGLLGPLIFAAKVRMQKIWQLNVDWDEILTRNDAEIWEVFRNQLKEMGEIVVPRCVFPHSKPQSVELHGFCDASSLGYGACVYVRSCDMTNCKISLLTSKSRIAPLKNAKLTIPRLELSGALVLARLISNITHNLKISFSRIILWSDPTTALSWIKTDPSRLKTYVSNRVIEIQELAKGIEWRYVGTHDNPADIISRGLLPSEIRDCEIWWSGPNFLYHDEEDWPQRFQHIPTEQLPETKNPTISLTVTDPPAMFYLFATENNFRKMQRIMGLVLRYIDHIRPKKDRQHRYGVLRIPELQRATVALASIAQQETFPKEFSCLDAGKVIHSKSN